MEDHGQVRVSRQVHRHSSWRWAIQAAEDISHNQSGGSHCSLTFVCWCSGCWLKQRTTGHLDLLLSLQCRPNNQHKEDCSCSVPTSSWETLHWAHHLCERPKAFSRWQVHLPWKSLSHAVHIDDEVNIRIVKANAAFGHLRNLEWERSGIKQETKLKFYQAVLPTLLYGCKAWTVYQRHARKLNHLHLSCLRKLLRVKG